MAGLVHAKPSLANYDYTHINFRGGRHLAGLLYETLIYGKEQYERRKAYEAEEMAGGVDPFAFRCLVGSGTRPFASLSAGG